MMHPFDMLIVVILGYCLIIGIFKGFIREAASIAGVVTGFYAAYVGYQAVVPFFAGFIQTPAYQATAAFILVFTVVCLLVNAVGMLIRFLVKLALLGAVDRLLGAFLGTVKGVLVVSLIFILLITFLPIGGKQMVAESHLAPYVNAVSGTLVRVVPEKKRRAFLYGMERLKKDWAAEPAAEDQ
jgi:membrane protein required for colicin V production